MAIKKNRSFSNVRIWIWIALATFLFGAFLLMTSEVREAAAGETELIGSLDHAVLTFAGSLRNPSLNNAAINITALGSGTVLGLFVIVLTLFFGLKRRYLDAAQILGAAVGSGLLTSVMKAYFERPRPSGLSHLVDVQSYSYPSGHSLSGAAVYFTFSILLFLNFRTSLERSISIAVAMSIILLIALSRIYLGVHYFSDVLAGVLVGISWAATLAVLRVFFETRSRSHAIE